MRWTVKFAVLIAVLAGVYAVTGGSRSASDSGESPLYESTLSQAYIEMRAVRSEPGSDDVESGKPDLILATVTPPKFTECEVTHHPNAYTCAPRARTNCNVGTWCPKVNTECPGKFIYTKCKATHSPTDITDCGARTTACVVNTWCPASQSTSCSRSHKFTECNITRVPSFPTNCSHSGASATSCQAETYCPEQAQKCAPVTKCPRKFTECDVTHTPNALTMCMVDPEGGGCAAVTWHPPNPTKCPKKVTTCEITHKPNGPTKCSSEPTKCQAYTLCPKKETQCPVITTLCPPKETECPIITTQCPVCKKSDIGVKKVETPPPDGCGQYTPLVHVHNYGTDPASYFEVVINILPLYYEDRRIVEDVIYSGQTLAVEMSSLSLPEGDYEICAHTIWPPDEDPMNDELCEGFYCGADQGSMTSRGSGIEPRVLALFANYPNPFTRETSVSYMTPKATHVTIRAYDVTGRAVVTLVDEEKSRGLHTVTWSATGLDSGVYFVRMVADGRDFAVKATLVR